MAEKCVRCGEVGEDRRSVGIHAGIETNLSRTDIPFEARVMFSALEDAEFTQAVAPTKLPLPGEETLVLHPGMVTTDSLLTPYIVHTVRVCKKCRGALIHHLVVWWKSFPSEPPQG